MLQESVMLMDSHLNVYQLCRFSHSLYLLFLFLIFLLQLLFLAYCFDCLYLQYFYRLLLLRYVNLYSSL